MKQENTNPIAISTGKTVLAIGSAILILVLAQMLSLLIAELAAAIGLPPAAGNVAAGLLYPALTLCGVSLLCGRLLHAAPADFKITKFCLKPVWCAAALIMPLSVSVILVASGGRWERAAMDGSAVWASVTAAVFFFGLACGIVEEIVFRGVIMSVLEYRFNKAAAIIAPSVLFGLLHIIGNSLDFISTLQLLAAGAIVGILFSLVTYESGGVWCSALIHGIWNIAMVGGIVHIGTAAEKTSIFNYVLDSRSFLLTGGDFGIEASIVSIAAYLIFTGLAAYLNLKRK